MGMRGIRLGMRGMHRMGLRMWKSRWKCGEWENKGNSGWNEGEWVGNVGNQSRNTRNRDKYRGI